MKLTLKTLKQEQLDVEVDPSCKISEVKAKITEKYSHPVEAQRLIFAGKILDDAQTVESYNITEKEFLVLMVKKIAAPAKKPEPAPAPAQPEPVAQPAAPSPAQPEPASPAPVQPAQPSAPIQSPSVANGDEFEAMISRIAEMGFEREQIILALQASFNNPERAIEYLMTGIPDNVRQQAAPAPVQPAQPAAPSPAQPAAPAPANPGNLFQQAEIQQQQQQQSGESNPIFEQLRQLPNFDAIRQLVQQQPQLLQHVLQNLAQANPQLYQLIIQNQQEFIRLLNEPVPEGTPNLADSLGNAGPDAGPRPGEIRVTPEEKEAIERLESLGFPKHKAIEAFFACDKDENLAANYLLEHGYDDDPMDGAQ